MAKFECFGFATVQGLAVFVSDNGLTCFGLSVVHADFTITAA